MATRTFSVWDHNRRSYDYYVGEGADGTHALAPPIRSHGDLGAAPEQAAWIVPAGARKVGSGELPHGRIAVLESATGFGDIPQSTVKIGVIAGLAYLAWRWLS